MWISRFFAVIDTESAQAYKDCWQTMELKMNTIIALIRRVKTRLADLREKIYGQIILIRFILYWTKRCREEGWEDKK